MISVERCREILGPSADGMDENAIRELLSELYLLGEVLIDRAVAQLSAAQKDDSTHKNSILTEKTPIN
jgi:hypothetical protein